MGPMHKVPMKLHIFENQVGALISRDSEWNEILRNMEKHILRKNRKKRKAPISLEVSHQLYVIILLFDVCKIKTFP